MGKYLLFMFVITLTKCNDMKECQISKHSKVMWNDSSQKFENVTISTGESMVFINIDSCSVSKSSIQIKGRIVDDSVVLNPELLLTSNALLLNCNSEGHVTDTLYRADDKGYFKIDIPRVKENFIVVKNQNEKYGLRYNINDIDW